MIQVPVVEGNSADVRLFLVGSSLNSEEREEIVSFLRANIDVFAWKLNEMHGIDAKVICHKLHIDKNFKPMKKKPGELHQRKLKLQKSKSGSC